MNTARAMEARVLARCSEVARGLSDAAYDEIEANVFAIATWMVDFRFPVLGGRLKAAADAYFNVNPQTKLPLAEVINRGWIVTLPRFKDRLYRELDIEGRLNAPC